MTPVALAVYALVTYRIRIVRTGKRTWLRIRRLFGKTPPGKSSLSDTATSQDGFTFSLVLLLTLLDEVADRTGQYPEKGAGGEFAAELRDLRTQIARVVQPGETGTLHLAARDAVGQLRNTITLYTSVCDCPTDIIWSGLLINTLHQWVNTRESLQKTRVGKQQGETVFPGIRRVIALMESVPKQQVDRMKADLFQKAADELLDTCWRFYCV